MWTNEQILNAVERCFEDKGKRNFVQSVELAINFKGIDFSKTENRLDLEISLPKGRGKEVKVVVFADGPIATDAKSGGADIVISGLEIPKYDKNEIKKMAKNSFFFAQPQLMISVGKAFGQILGARGKLPKPIVGDIKAIIKSVRNKVNIKTKGKNLPTVHCIVGSETMSPEDITENILSVLSAIKTKLSEHYISSAYIKLSMGKAYKIGE